LSRELKYYRPNEGAQTGQDESVNLPVLLLSRVERNKSRNKQAHRGNDDSDQAERDDLDLER